MLKYMINQQIENINKNIERYFFKIPIVLGIIIVTSLLLRLYFTSWDQLSNSQDAYVFMNEAIDFSKGHGNFDIRSFWPLVLSLFYFPVTYSTNLEYLNILRMVSIGISVITIPVLYLIAKKFMRKEYALIASALFGLEANIVENSIFGITEPLFILLSLFSIYFLLSRDPYKMLLAFLFAGLAIDTRLNGIVLIIVSIIICTYKIKKNKKFLQTLIFGSIIFIIIAFPHTISSFEKEGIPFVAGINVVQSISDKTISVSAYNPDFEITPSGKIKNALLNEFLHIFRLLVPYLAIFTPIGIFFAIKKLDFNKNVLFLVMGITLIVAIFQYTQSIEYRNLFLLIPFFCIFGGIAIQEISNKTELRKVFLVFLFAGILLLSFNFLRDRGEVDQMWIDEKYELGKFIVKNFDGRIMGDLYTETVWNIQEPYIGRINGTSGIFTENISLITPGIPIITEKQLEEYISKNHINYLVVDKDFHRAYPVFERINENIENFSYLSVVYDSESEKYQKIDVKILKVDFDKLKD